MTFQATVYRILIVAANDVIEEQKTIQEVISSWNTKYSAQMKVLLLPDILKTQMLPLTGDHPKELTTKHIIQDFDILIGAFWTRIGAHPGLAESNTMEVLKEFMSAGKSVMIYLSSAPVIPSSIDLINYENLMKFTDDCRKKGLVTRYDSILDFREKLSTRFTPKLTKIHAAPKIKTNKNHEETTEKETIEIISNKFFDLIEIHKSNWTTEKNIQPINLDDGKKILVNLTRDILSFKETLAKTFSKEITAHIDQIVSNLKALQKHRLYLDDKSYADFWKLGDEIFASLYAITGNVGKEAHTQDIDNTMVSLLIELLKIQNKLIEPITPDLIAKETGLSIPEINRYLYDLLKAGFISQLLKAGSQTRYLLSDAGRRLLAERGIK